MAFDKKEYMKHYEKDNKDIIRLQARQRYRKKHPICKMKDLDCIKKRSEKFKKYNREYQKNRRTNDPLFKLKGIIRCSIYRALNGFRKIYSTEDILGCTYKQFKTHLESQFEPWMSWDNWGGRLVTEQNASWDVDHIIPLSSAKSEEEIYKLNHYTNLQPLCSYVNRFIKRDNI